ncbi:DUF5677 domain-containing protein [Massilia timonae]|uniref:DUF5677 domain-containing protein n=1 Tax=Massilia timonae TaxID=47229 RepID=UPI00289E8329|nr:DUF5677 domain-containing protein [Massilia timonae]
MARIPTVQDYADGLAEHAKRLAFVATLEGKGEACARDVEVRKIASRCAELVRGASALGAQGNSLALAVIGRTMVESLILILWVCVSDENAIHQSQAGLAEFTRVARINIEQGKLKIRSRETGADETAEFLKSDRLKKLPAPKKVFDQAAEAGVEDLYQVFYRFMSLATHGHDMIGDEEDPEAGLIVDLQAIGAMCVAIGHVSMKWLLGRVRTDNEALRQVLGIGR